MIHKKHTIRLILFLMIVFLVGGLLIYALWNSNIDSANTWVNSEVIYMVLVLAVLLPIFLIVLIAKVSNRETEVFEVTQAKNPSVSPMESSRVPESSAEKTEEEPKEETKTEEKSRFYMLSQIDREMEHYEAPEYDDKVTLKEICERFRRYAGSRLGLYYDIQDIRRFIAGMAVTHIMILQGMSGTGKTSLAYAFGEFLRNRTVIVPIQPMWKERTDLLGYYNEFTKKFNETMLLEKMYEANYNDEIYITVLDEMNIARVEYYFAEFLSLLEIPNQEGRNIDVVSDRWENDPKLLRNGQLRLPENMWFIGTANNDDSTFAISDKVYDRAMIMNLDKKATIFEEGDEESMKISSSHLHRLYKEAMKEYRITRRNLNRIKELDEYMIKEFHLTFGNRIMKQIRSYVPVIVACGGTELEAIDDILSRKIIRKLESQNPVYVRNSASGLITYMDELFGEDKLPLCKAYIERIKRTV